MTTTASQPLQPSPPGKEEVPFGSNAVRLSPREWLVAGGLLAAIFWFTPSLWERIEPLPAEADGRIPYSLGEDYETYSRYCRSAAAEDRMVVLGDSVVWGHYVTGDQTLSHHLNRLAGDKRWANLGVDGIHPLAMAGLVEHYGRAIRGNRVLLFCNPLWMSSPTHDLQGEKEIPFNHPRLIPQFASVPCYKETFDGRLGIEVQRRVPLLGWVNHLRIAYFDNSDIADWAIEHPYGNPAGRITLELPTSRPSPEDSPRSWLDRDIKKYSPPWVDLEASRQWAAMERTIDLLRRRGNRVFVLVGPFNEHMIKPESLARYSRLKEEIARRLAADHVPHLVAPVLPSELYADASHPLAEGYRAVARELHGSMEFASF